MPQGGISTPELTLTEEQRKIETLNFNPAVDCILASSSHDTLNLWDLISAEQIYAFDVRDSMIFFVIFFYSFHIALYQNIVRNVNNLLKHSRVMTMRFNRLVGRQQEI